jgi:tetratricopeptide (TPR) repeat protein
VPRRGASYDEALAAVQQRLRLIDETEDLRLAVVPEALREALALNRALRAQPDPLPAFHALGRLHWLRGLARDGRKRSLDLEFAVDYLAPCFLHGAGPIPPPLLPTLARGWFGSALEWLTRADAAADPEELDRALSLLEKIADAVDSDRERALTLSNLGIGLRRRFEILGGPADLDRAAEAGARSVSTAAGDPGERVMLLVNYAGTLQLRYRNGGDDADLQRCVAVCRRAVELAPDRPEPAELLGIALRTRFERHRDGADLDEAVEVARAVTRRLRPGDPAYSRAWTALGNARAFRDPDAAVEALRTALADLAADRPERPFTVANLVTAMWMRHEQRGAIDDVDAIVELLRDTLDAPVPELGMRFHLLDSLGVALRARAVLTGARSDLDAAVDLARDVVGATQPGHVLRARHLINLTAALTERARRTGSAADADEAVDAAERAVADGPAGPDLARALANLGNARLQRLGGTHDDGTADDTADDVDAAVDALRRAAAGLDPSHPDQVLVQLNLSAALRLRSSRSGSAADLDAATAAAGRAAELLPDGHPQRAGVYLTLGNALRTAHERSGDRSARDRAVSAYTIAAGDLAAPPSLRALAACSGAWLSHGDDPAGAAALYEAAVLLLPEMTGGGLARADQQAHLGDFGGLAGTAAATALDDARPGESASDRATRSLALLEAGRGVLLSQAFDTRTDLGDLRGHHPDLAERYATLRDRLDSPAPQEAGPGPGTADRWGQAATLEHAAGRRRRLAADLAEVVARIRELPEFERFQLPPSPAELLDQGRHGDIAVLTVGDRRCDALLITAAGIRCLPLPDLDETELRSRAREFQDALARRSAGGAEDDLDLVLDGVLRWLWDVVAGPVLTALGRDSTPEPGHWPRLWWVPCGLLSLLPLHAAGYHADAGAGSGADAGTGRPPRTVLDRVVSSYAPTVRALRYARRTAAGARARPAGRSLVVAMPTTPGGPHDLAFAADEAERVRAALPGADLLLAAPDGAPAASAAGVPTLPEVRARLPHCRIAHFACHGRTDPDEPSHSALLLTDHATAPLTVAALADLRLDRAELAFLSACGTARNQLGTLVDESIQLTSAFQLAGFARVIGTLWEIDDEVAPAVAEAFHTALGGDPARSAEVLHGLVRELRDDDPSAPSGWAAHIHVGA